MKLHFDTLFINAYLATMDPKIPTPYGAIENGALGMKDGRIAWVGRMEDLPEYEAGDVREWPYHVITPGIVDCHTHLVFAGDRAKEFEMRLNGASYEDIARAGGGIVSTVKATRASSKEDLFQDSVIRIIDLRSEGVTTVEIKSGYGLDLETEIKMLEVAAELQAREFISVRKTFLGAHAVPPEYEGRADAYIDLVCDEMIPEIAARGLADAVDGFCENIGFSTAQIRRVFDAAKAHGLPVKLHAEQLSNQGGAKLAAEYNALSADHLEHLTEGGVKAMAEAGTVAVLLPAAFYFLKETQKPPIDLLRKHGVPMALATDCNPGSAPILSTQMIRNMACILFGLTPEEALSGMTREGAKALGLGDETGTLEVGKKADLAVWPIKHPAELSYWISRDLNPQLVLRGKDV